MKLTVAIFCMLLAASVALAQQPQAPDPATLQRAIQVLQQQRNNAQDQAAGAQAEAMRLVEENAKLNARIKELEKSDK